MTPRQLSPSLPLAFVLGLLLCLPFAGCKKEKKSGDESATREEPTKPTTDDATKPTTDEPAQAADAGAQAEAPETAIKTAFLYTVSGPNGEQGHLFGTMHMGVDAKKELPASVWRAVESSNAVAIEADITDPKLAMGMMRQDGTTLQQELGEKTWALLVEALGEPTAKGMNAFKPAAAAAALSMKGLPMTTPMEMHLLSLAKEKEMSIHYLEEGAFQLELLNKVMDAKMLTFMLEHPEENKPDELLAAYRSGDEAQLEKLMLDPGAFGKEDAEKNMEMMLYNRNANWIPGIEKLLAAKGAFIAVGAAHLVGERSVVDLLRKKGYTVTQVE